MKKMLVSAFASTVLALSLVACSGSSSNDKESNSASGDTSTAIEQSDEANSQESVVEEEQPAVEEIKDIEVAEVGYSISDSGYLHYGIKLHNPNETWGAGFPVVHITCKDTSGAIVSSDEWTLNQLLPQETAVFGNQAGNGSLTSDVVAEFTVTVDKDKWVQAQPEAEEPYTIEGLNSVNGDFNTSFTGQITMNVDDDNYAKPMLVLILRDADGNIVYGRSTYLQSELTQGTPSAFEFSEYRIPANATAYEVHANPWM